MMRSQSLFAALAMLLSAACSNSEPPIGRGLPKTFGYTPAFEERLRQRFPIGSDEQKLLVEIRSEKFRIQEVKDPSAPQRFSARYDASEGACREEWTIQWAAEQGKITDITGLNRQICF
jgi:hypothetical protein